VFKSKYLDLVDDFLANTIKVIMTTEPTYPIVGTKPVACVIDSGLIQLASYDSSTGSTNHGHWVASDSIINQRRRLVGQDRPDIVFAVNSRDSRIQPAMQEIKRADLSWALLLLSSTPYRFDSLAFNDPPSPEAVAAAGVSLWAIGALDSHGEITSLGRQMTNLPPSVTTRQAAMAIEYSSECQKKQRRMLYVGMIFLIVNVGSRLLASGKPTAAAMKCFCPESGILTLIHLVRPY
jgi:HrpA-like RNA helicase